jgi:hypothetical protein
MNLLMKKLIGSLEPQQNASNRWKSFEGSFMDIELPFDFKEFLKLLNEKGVRYLRQLADMRLVITVIRALQMIWMSGLPSILTMLKELSTL